MTDEDSDFTPFRFTTWTLLKIMLWVAIAAWAGRSIWLGRGISPELWGFILLVVLVNILGGAFGLLVTHVIGLPDDGTLSWEEEENADAEDEAA